MPEKDLIDRANLWLKLSEKATNHAFSPLRAQIYMQEIARRTQDQMTHSMLS
jgi:hypothetical protein